MCVCCGLLTAIPIKSQIILVSYCLFTKGETGERAKENYLPYRAFAAQCFSSSRLFLHSILRFHLPPTILKCGSFRLRQHKGKRGLLCLRGGGSPPPLRRNASHMILGEQSMPLTGYEASLRRAVCSVGAAKAGGSVSCVCVSVHRISNGSADRFALN